MTFNHLPSYPVLVNVAISRAHPPDGMRMPRWECVARIFDTSPLISRQLCRLSNLNPEALIEGHKAVCPECNENAMDADGVCDNCS